MDWSNQPVISAVPDVVMNERRVREVEKRVGFVMSSFFYEAYCRVFAVH